ncbi:hypothetical protein H9P43_005889 [Blastocladiella emersonii ATCC 22665]|nr:hypothetical protein H9P43_005889 [Blastocladiella emersonii ATCC 22665]
MTSTLSSMASALPNDAFRATMPLAWLEPILADWRVPAAVAVVYGATVVALNPTKAQAAANRGKGSGPLMTAAVFLHNVVLCAFSAWVFVGAAPIFARNLLADPSVATWCDRSGAYWTEALGYYTWVFYLSKYWEILDTVIILAKGKQSSLLQTYHHIGAILCMHVNYYTASTPVVFFVIFNSFIHTIMYLYYALTTAGISPPGKKYLTRMQISQFVVGMSMALSFLVLEAVHGEGSCLKNRQWNRFAILFNVAYLIPLTYLFVDFMWRTYGRSRPAATKPKADGGKAHLKEE